tara:strand:- start:3972 stop:4373 length:402 start_codon:yes stop_codon:yes gene_type:complete
MRDKNIIFKDLDEWDKFVKPKYSQYEEMYKTMKDNGWKEGWLGAKEDIDYPEALMFHMKFIQTKSASATELLNRKFRYDVYNINDNHPFIITSKWGRKKHKKEPLFKITPEVLIYLMKRMKIKELLKTNTITN